MSRSSGWGPAVESETIETSDVRVILATGSVHGEVQGRRSKHLQPACSLMCAGKRSNSDPRQGSRDFQIQSFSHYGTRKSGDREILRLRITESDIEEPRSGLRRIGAHKDCH